VDGARPRHERRRSAASTATNPLAWIVTFVGHGPIVYDVAEQLLTNRISAVPIVDDAGKLEQGIITCQRGTARRLLTVRNEPFLGRCASMGSPPTRVVCPKQSANTMQPHVRIVVA
jgi:hypothetical protein